MLGGVMLTVSAMGQVTTIHRLVPKLAVAGEKAGGRGEVALGGGRVALGMPGAINPKTGVACGGVALFDTKTLKELPTLFPPDADANAGMEFGYAVASSGSLLVIGAPGADSSPTGSNNLGAVYVYDLVAKKFIGGNNQELFLDSERWGQAVAVDGDLAAFSSPISTGSGGNQSVPAGAVLAGDFRTGAFSFVSPDSTALAGVTTGAAGDAFGTSIALRGNLLVVGSPGATVGGQAGAGRVTVVSVRQSDRSIFLSEINNPAPAANERFGQELALGTRHLQIGAPGDAGGNGKLFLREARTPLNMVPVADATGGSPTSGMGTAVATEGNRIFYLQGSQVVGQTYNAPYSLNNPFWTWEADSGGHGAALAVADDLLAVGAPGWNGNVGSVVLHSTRALNVSDFYQGQFTGSSAPEFPVDGITLADFPEVAVNLQAPPDYPAGNPLYVAKLGGTAAATNPLAVFAHDSSVTQTQLLGFAVKSSVAGVSRPIGNGVGRWWWRVTYNNKLPDFFSSDGNTLFSEMHNGTGNLWGVNLPLKVADELRVSEVIADAGVVSLRLKQGGAVNAGNDSAIYSMAPSDLTNHAFLVREGDNAGVDTFIGELAPRVALRGASYLNMGALTGDAVSPATNQALLSGSVIVVRRGQSAAGVRDTGGQAIAATFSTFTAEVANADMDLLFRATLNPSPGITSANNEGLWSNRTGTFDLVLQKGQQAPTLPTGVKVKRFLNQAILEGDDVLILAQVSGPGINAANDTVVFLSKEDSAEPGFFEVLAREGDRLPGTKGAKIGNILRLEVASTDEGSGSNRYGLLCSLVTEAGRVTPADNLIWVIGDALPGMILQTAARQPLPKLRKGETNQILGPGYDKLTSIAFPAVTRDATGSLLTGMAHVIDPRHGGSSGVATFPNKRKAVLMIW